MIELTWKDLRAGDRVQVVRAVGIDRGFIGSRGTIVASPSLHWGEDYVKVGFADVLGGELIKSNHVMLTKNLQKLSILELMAEASNTLSYRPGTRVEAYFQFAWRRGTVLRLDYEDNSYEVGFDGTGNTGWVDGEKVRHLSLLDLIAEVADEVVRSGDPRGGGGARPGLGHEPPPSGHCG